MLAPDVVTGEPTIRLGTSGDIPLLAPLWLELHHHHAEVMPELGPYQDDAVSWHDCRGLYERLLQRPDSCLLVAEDGARPIAYGLCRVAEPEENWAADTWVTAGDRLGEIVTLVVGRAHRNRGVGGRLLDGLHRHLDAAGIDDVVIGVLPGNDGAVRLYGRYGYQPTWLYMSRFGQSPTGRVDPA